MTRLKSISAISERGAAGATGKEVEAALSKARMQMCDGCGYLVLERRVHPAHR